MALVIFFRGKSTAEIRADARRMGLFKESDTVLTVCLPFDELEEPGDVEVINLIRRLSHWGGEGRIVVVCSGGTTAQVVPIVSFLASAAVKHDMECSFRRKEGREWQWQALDVQPSGIGFLAGD